MKEHLIEILESIRDRDLNAPYSKEELDDSEKYLKVVCTNGFEDIAFKKFMSVISKRPFSVDMQVLVGNTVEYPNNIRGFTFILRVLKHLVLVDVMRRLCSSRN